MERAADVARAEEALAELDAEVAAMRQTSAMRLFCDLFLLHAQTMRACQEKCELPQQRAARHVSAAAAGAAAAEQGDDVESAVGDFDAACERTRAALAASAASDIAAVEAARTQEQQRAPLRALRHLCDVLVTESGRVLLAAVAAAKRAEDAAAAAPAPAAADGEAAPPSAPSRSAATLSKITRSSRGESGGTVVSGGGGGGTSDALNALLVPRALDFLLSLQFVFRALSRPVPPCLQAGDAPVAALVDGDDAAPLVFHTRRCTAFLKFHLPALAESLIASGASADVASLLAPLAALELFEFTQDSDILIKK